MTNTTTPASARTTTTRTPTTPSSPAAVRGTRAGIPTAAIDFGTLNAINTKADATDNKVKKLTAAHKEHVAEHEKLGDVVNYNADSHNKLVGGHSRLKGHVNSIDVKLKAIDKKMPRWILIVAVIIGVITGFVWNAIDFAISIPLPNSAPIVYHDWHDEWYAALIAGILAFGVVMLIAFLIGTFFGKSGESPDFLSDEERAELQGFAAGTYVPTAPVNPTLVKPAPPADEAPTEPIPAQGVTSTPDK